MILTEQTRKNAILIIKLLLGIVIVFFLFNIIVKNYNEIESFNWQFEIIPFIFGSILMISSYLYVVVIWHLLIREFGGLISFSKSYSSWSYSLMARYIPGLVFPLVSRFMSFEKYKISNKNITAAFLLESLIMIASAIIVFLLLMQNFFSSLSQYKLYLHIITFALLLCLWPPVCKSIFNFFFRLLKKQETIFWPSYRLTLALIFLGCISYFQAGIGFYLFIISFYPLPFSNCLSIIGAMAGSSLSTIIIFFVPAGIGVRDGTLAYLLSQFIPLSFSVLIALLCRLWMTALEMLLPLSAFIVDKIIGNNFNE